MMLCNIKKTRIESKIRFPVSLINKVKQKFFNFFRHEKSSCEKKSIFFAKKAHKSGLVEAVSSRKRSFWKIFIRFCHENV
jgi:hypothetical protein